MLGGSGFTVSSLAVPSFEIGYWLRQSAEGHGYMSEAVRLITTYLFDNLGAQRVMIRCDARNARSKAVAERLGFPFEGGTRHDEIGTDGTVRDSLIYAMIPDDFARVRRHGRIGSPSPVGKGLGVRAVATLAVSTMWGAQGRYADLGEMVDGVRAAGGERIEINYMPTREQLEQLLARPDLVVSSVHNICPRPTDAQRRAHSRSLARRGR